MSSSSPYFKTKIIDDYRDILQMPSMPMDDNDEYYTIESKFDRRPDLLAYSLYGNTRLWWVFARRNMNDIKDPIKDFRAGVTIRIPSADALSTINA
tara:strand:- start:1442 stop:1729 length:288 start_codon:yes stop_codon:yes gene_type:complete